jgi:hypothetical protein
VPVFDDSARTPVVVRCSRPCSWESLKVSLPSGEYVYGTSHCESGSAMLFSRMADIVMTLPVEPGSKMSETALDSDPVDSPGWLGSTEPESASA